GSPRMTRPVRSVQIGLPEKLHRTRAPMSDESAIPSDRLSRPVLEYPFDETPEPGVAREIAPGVLWLRMPLPFTLDHINLWALRDGDRWAIVDTGVQSREIAAAWRTLLGPGGALEE